MQVSFLYIYLFSYFKEINEIIFQFMENFSSLKLPVLLERIKED